MTKLKTSSPRAQGWQCRDAGPVATDGQSGNRHARGGNGMDPDPARGRFRAGTRAAIAGSARDHCALDMASAPAQGWQAAGCAGSRSPPKALRGRGRQMAGAGASVANACGPRIQEGRARGPEPSLPSGLRTVQAQGWRAERNPGRVAAFKRPAHAGMAISPAGRPDTCQPSRPRVKSSLPDKLRAVPGRIVVQGFSPGGGRRRQEPARPGPFPCMRGLADVPADWSIAQGVQPARTGSDGPADMGMVGARTIPPAVTLRPSPAPAGRDRHAPDEDSCCHRVPSAYPVPSALPVPPISRKGCCAPAPPVQPPNQGAKQHADKIWRTMSGAPFPGLPETRPASRPGPLRISFNPFRSRKSCDFSEDSCIMRQRGPPPRGHTSGHTSMTP